MAEARVQRSRRGGRAARQAQRAVTAGLADVPFLTRRLAPFEVLSEEGLSLIEENADTILEQIGVEVMDYPEALEIFRRGGADVVGTRVRFPRGLCRDLIRQFAPSSFVQRARNPQRSVTIGGSHLVFAPVYGPPFVRDMDDGRRYATIQDFQNFVKLAYASPSIHHSGGTLCEPVDLPVDTRHLDMIQSHVRFSDKPFMGSVTHPDRAADTVDMARIVFGSDVVDSEVVLISLINANSPMSWDHAMLGSAKVYAEAGQATIITPFILAGAMSPVTAAATATQTLAEAMAGMAFCQMVRPGAPVVFGSFASSMSMQTGAPTFGTPEPALVLYTVAALARRLGVPFRSGGSLTASKVADAQAAYESAMTLSPTLMGGTNFVLHAAGWLEGGLTAGYEKFVLDADQLGAARALVGGVEMSESALALDTILETGPGQHFLGTAHTLENFETAFWKSELANNDSFEQWFEDGKLDSVARANAVWKRRLREYNPPVIDEAMDEALQEFVERRKLELRDDTGAVSSTHRQPASIEDLAVPDRDGIIRALENPVFELIPIGNVIDQTRFLPAGSTVSVTASPTKGMDATIELAEALSAEGFDVVPHLSARMTTDRNHLERILGRLTAAGITRAFVVGGDAEEPGEFFDGLALLEAMEAIGHDLTDIGVPSYPEGHAFISTDALDEALWSKQPFATSMTTQMCFSPEPIVGWLHRQRLRSVSLPAILGIPGVADRRRLLKISARIGVGDSIGFLRKNTAMASRLVKPGSYNPAELLEGLGSNLDDPVLDIVGVHIYTFNSCEATEHWRQEYLDSLR